MNEFSKLERNIPGAGDGPRLVEIRTLGPFAVAIAGTPLTFPRKTPRRPLGLLKAIVAMGHPAVCGYRLTDALWPDAEADAAHQAFTTALHRLRRLLRLRDAVVLHDARVRLDAGLCWVDVWAFERLASLAEAAGPRDGDPARTLRQALELYRGDFLADDDAPWAIATRERLRERFVRLVTRQAGQLEAAGRWHESLHFFHQALEADDRAEALYQGVMRATLHLGRKAEGLTVFRRLQGTRPFFPSTTASADTEQLLHQLLK